MTEILHFSTMTDHAVADYLRRLLQSFPPSMGWEPSSAEKARAVLRFGRPFVGIARPKGFRRQRKLKACYMNAVTMAFRGCGTYVEGFARSGSSGIVTDHAWITLDGEHAIDQTWPDADKCQYFGIPFSEKVLTKVMRRHGYYGLLDPVDYDLLELRAA
jgi:hypothetical protein